MHRLAAFVVALVVVVLTLSLGASPASAQSTRPSADSQKSPPAKIESANPQPPSQAPSYVDARRALSTRLPEMKLTDVRLEDAIAFLQDASGANIHVNWRALETVNVTRQTPVTLRMSPMPLRKLLSYVLTQADGRNLVTFHVDDGVIEVTTRELADERLITKVYPVEDLLLSIPDFTDAPTFQLQAPQTSGRGAGGSGQSFLGGGTTTEETRQTTKAGRGHELVRLIMDTVQPEAWRENGGTSSIRFFRDRLIVTAPRSVHEQIGGTIE